ncbi:MAG: hypothetical protein LCH66_13615 [Actinobacteria bacterium]|nr:hypothetical protein [Actinomycetota bacterium]
MAATSVALLFATGLTMATPANADVGNEFGLEKVRAGMVHREAPTGKPQEIAARSAHGLSVATSASGESAIIDESLLDYGAVSATGADFVELDWKDIGGATGYTVRRDGNVLATLPAGTSSYRDSAVKRGADYRYQIDSIVEGAGSDQDAGKAWGFRVRIPSKKDLNSLQTTAGAQALAAGTAATSTVSWVTFIPNYRVDAPGYPCEYGSGYQFGGDNRTYNWASSSYRTAVHATVTWSTKNVTGNVAIGTTRVYNKATGALVASRTASAANTYARKLASGTNYVDVRLVTHAGNPFCGTITAIDGGLSMHLTQAGNYAVISGSHRRAPNHHVYIYDGGGVTDVYRRDNAGFVCLAGSAMCELANFYGSGSF